MADKRAYFKMDVGYLSNPKVATLLDEHPRAILLHLQCIAYSAQHLTDGVVPVRMAMRLACAEQCDLDLLLQCGLLERLNERTVLVHDYLEHQRSSREVKTASEQAKRAAEARWLEAQSNASSMPDALPTAMPREREERESNTCASTEVEREFAEWYAAYPKKKGKGQAVKAYRTARKKASAQVLLDALNDQVPDLVRKGLEFAPYPATWLNGERWLDESNAASSGGFPVNGTEAEQDAWIKAQPLPTDGAYYGGSAR